MLRDRIELVIVAGRAADGQSQKHRARRVDAILGVDRFEFLDNGATFVRRDVAAVEASGDLLVDGADWEADRPLAARS